MAMIEVSKEYDFNAIEEKWIKSWDESVYYFDWTSCKPQYIIDTPPPYPTGDFHIGNALNWCYMDFVARYKRMQGYNVMFPQGWDCHGLPTEVKVEEIHNITKNEVPREEFRRLCEKMTEEAIERFRKSIIRLGISIDWSNEYITMRPRYYVLTQRSFVQMYEKGLIYRGDHPVNWCPRCGTAIAFAEVEYEPRTTTLNYIRFEAEGGSVEIATTRPELLPACVAVAVNPSDDRYKNYIDKALRVPLFDYQVPVFSDPAVDPRFGTGMVMICTFGDRQDVRWWIEHKLPLRQVIDRNGRMAELSGIYRGLGIEETRKAIIQDLKQDGILFKQEHLDQNVGLCWRCKTPIEILSERQWFVKINSDEIVQASEEIEWIPSHMQIRLKNWAESVEWDWCISRQRIFATPIPVWYCNKCGETLVADEKWLPLDPNRCEPPIKCKCGSDDFMPEIDVLDTWMDSSISALAVSGWLQRDDPRYPTQLRPQGHDIIRTWAFYTILRTKALVDTRPWDVILINGMALGEDGHKMSKSLNNFIRPEEVFGTNGADVLRQWAALGGAPGNDVMFQWKEITAASRFQQKLWSIHRFSGNLIAKTGEKPSQVDRWLLGELDKLIRIVSKSLEEYQFDEAFRAIRVFVWEILADNYIELVKTRLYGSNGPKKSAAQNTLFCVIETLMRLMAPFTPFIAEEIYFSITGKSVHNQSWPSSLDCEVDHAGLQIKEIAAAIRRFKSEKGLALNARLPGIVVYSEFDLETIDLQGATNSPIEIRKGRPEIEMNAIGIKPITKILGPKFKDKTGRIIEALNAMAPSELAKQKAEGVVKINLNGALLEIVPESVDVITETLCAGEAVDVLKLGEAIVLVKK
ncbi:MAG: valine--tRNA ligase [Methanotrichaceae archaeon]|nr:valine--tRNA ligase [Methanotrichaceae archaeon]